MSQARRKQRINTPNQQLIGHGLREIVLIFFCFMGLYLFVSLVTYYPGDPGWSHSGRVEEVHNKGGVAGALFSDVFFYLFGYFAYLFPIMVGWVGWLIYQGRHHDILAEPKNLILPCIGFILTLSAGCGLAIVHFAAHRILLPSHAGGILGMLVGKSLQAMFSQLGATLLLIALFFTGVTLLTGLSWLKLMDTLGYYTLRWMPVVIEYSKTRIIPQVMRYSGFIFRFLSNILKSIFGYAQTGSKSAWSNWQSRREDKRQRNGFEPEDDDYFKKQDSSAKNLSEADKPQAILKQKPVEPDSSVMPTVEIDNTEVNKTVVSSALLPDLVLLSDVPEKSAATPSIDVLSQWLLEGFNTVGMEVIVKAVHPGPVLTSFEVQPTSPVNTARLDDLSEALATALKVAKVRIVEVMPGILGIETPNIERETIYLKELLSSSDFQEYPSPLPIALGKESNGQAVIIDLTRIPHILMVGSQVTDKTVSINTLLVSLIYKSTPNAVRFILINSSPDNLGIYADLPHLLTPIITEKAAVLQALQWCIHEMERRYRLIADLGARTIEGYNQAVINPNNQQYLKNLTENTQPLPHIILVINEIADFMLTQDGKPIEDRVMLLAQKARAAGIHLILATQYPSPNVVTNLLRDNMPTRIAFQVTNKSESRTVLGQMGAEMLLGQGDMLYMTAGTGMPVRIHGSFVTEEEVNRIVITLKNRAKPVYVDLQLGEKTQ